MSVPQFVFIDTSALEALSFNFRAARLMAFQQAAQASGLSLVLPDPTRREIERHMRSAATEAANKLSAVPQRAGFVESWRHWPPRTGKALAHEFEGLALSEWRQFKESFRSVESLDYEGINLPAVMTWYERGLPPFSEKGKKKYEFPDALALASILAFVEKNDCQVAVVALDGDFRRACSVYSSLNHFSSLSALTELLLGQPELIERVHELLRPALEGEDGRIADAIADEFSGLAFDLADDDGEADDPEPDDIVIKDIDVIGLGERECTCSFSSDVSFSVRAVVPDPDGWFHDEGSTYVSMGNVSGRIHDSVEITGVIKVALREDNVELGDVEYIQLDIDEVSVRGTLESWEMHD